MEKLIQVVRTRFTGDEDEDDGEDEQSRARKTQKRGDLADGRGLPLF